MKLIHRNSALLWEHNDGRTEPAFLFGSDSPESRLRECDKHQLDVLHSCGINTITLTMFGGDATDVHFYVDRNDLGKGVREDVIAKWTDYCNYWYSLSPYNVICPMVFEQEDQVFWLDNVDHFERHCDIIHGIVDAYRAVPYVEEWQVPNSFPIDAFKRFAGIMREAGFEVIGAHNPNAPHEADSFTSMIGVVDVAFIQSAIRDIQTITNRNTARGFAVIASEVSEPYGFGTDAEEEFRAWCTTPGLSGAFAFLGGVDQAAVDHEKYRALYEYISKPEMYELGNTPCPLYWQAAPWSTANVEPDMVLRVEPGKMASVETRAFIPIDNTWLTAFFDVSGGPVEIRFRLIDEHNSSAQAAIVARGDGQIEVGSGNGEPERICFDVLNFMPGAPAATVRITSINT